MTVMAAEGPRPSGPPGGTGTERAWLACALAGAVALGVWIAKDPTFLHVQVALEAGTLVPLAVGLVLAVLILRYPGAGLLLLVAAVYLNLSQVLVRHHDLPSYLQLLALPLFLAALLERRRGAAVPPGGRGVRLVLALLAFHILAILLTTTVAMDRALADERLVEAAKGFAVALLLVLLVTSRARMRAAGWTLVAAGALLAGIALIQAITGDYARDFGGLARIKHAHIHGSVFQPRIAGPLGDPNYFAQILLVLVPLALFLGWEERSNRLRVLAFAAAGTMVAATVLTYSRGGALALGGVLLASLLVRGINVRRVAAGAAVLLVIAALLPQDFSRRVATVVEILPGQEEDVLQDSSFQERLLLAGVAWEMFRAQPVLGVGAGNYAVRFDDYAGQVASAARDYGMADDARYPHNLYLELGAEGGVVGLASFLAVMAAVLAALHHARRRFRAGGDPLMAGLAAALAIGIGGYLVSSLFLHGHHQRYLWLLVGLAAALHALAPARGGGGR
jgi:putative inorganic carbon (hco3(-)) transporter